MIDDKPNFLIVGAAKSGTTSLYQYLSKHPQIFMPTNKEPNFFVRDYQQKMNPQCPSYEVDQRRMVFSEEEYWELFKDVEDRHKAIGEATVTYLYKPNEAIPSIKKTLGDPRIVIILRNPIRRAFSHYNYACELGFEELSFMDAIKEEPKRLKNNWSSTFAYIDQGRYYKQVKSYLENFLDVKIIIFEEFIKDPQFFLKDLYAFLDVDVSFKNSFEEEYNVSGIPRFRSLQKLLLHENPLKKGARKILSLFVSSEKLRSWNRKIRSLNQDEKKEITDKQLQHLRGIYKDEISKLEQLLNRNLEIWKVPHEN